MNSPQNRLSASIILKATYGYTMLPSNDPFIDVLERAAAMTSGAGATGGTLVDVFPMRQSLVPSCHRKLFGVDSHYAVRHIPPWLPLWFPGVAVKRHCLAARKLVSQVMSAPLDHLKEERVSTFK